MHVRPARLIVRAAPAVVAAILVVGCADDGSRIQSDSTGPDRNTPADTNSPSLATSPPTSSPNEASAERIHKLRVEIEDGEATPNAEQVDVPVGVKIQLIVTSDVAEEVHVHGYDELLAVEPGEVAVLEFDADQAGRFDVEIHGAGTLVYQLVVTS